MMKRDMENQGLSSLVATSIIEIYAIISAENFEPWIVANT